MAAPTHVATGAIAVGTSSAAPAYPAGISAGNLLLMPVTAKLDTVSFPAIAGWTLQLDVSVGGGAPGAGTGPQRLGLYTQIATGSESGTVTITPTGTANVTVAGISCWAVGSGKAFDFDVASGSDATSHTAVSITKGGSDREVLDDVMWYAIATSFNSNMGSSTVSATGAVYTTPATEHVDTGTTNGDDARLSINSKPVVGGAATAATVATSTTTTATTSGAVFVRLREVNASASSTVHYASITSSTGWTPTGGTVVAVLGDGSDGGFITSSGNPSALLLDGTLAPLTTPTGDLVVTVRMDKEFAASGSLTAKLYDGATLRATVSGVTIPDAITDVPITFLATNIAAVTSWATGVRLTLEATAA